MNLHLALAGTCTNTGCQVCWLEDNTCCDAVYAGPLIENRIPVKPGDLVAVNRDTESPQVVFRWAGRPANPERLPDIFFPKIEAMYAQIEIWNALDPKQVVEAGYDQIAGRYAEWALSAPSDARVRYTKILLDALPAGAEVLDLGCGAGLPTTRPLAERFKVTGVDISHSQIELARKNVPEAQFVQGDITRHSFPRSSFDAVAAFYSLIHIPREEQPRLLQDLAGWLRPGGWLVATMGTRSVSRDFGENFLGARMFWSSFDVETNRRLVQEAGLRIVSDREETAIEFGMPVTFLWMIARKVTE